MQLVAILLIAVSTYQAIICGDRLAPLGTKVSDVEGIAPELRDGEVEKRRNRVNQESRSPWGFCCRVERRTWTVGKRERRSSLGGI